MGTECCGTQPLILEMALSSELLIKGEYSSKLKTKGNKVLSLFINSSQFLNGLSNYCKKLP